ncbi:hypothetical protein SH2C18_44350 [Clostridium sediminicola]|uniref:hypothetical protein n=1 Tax=Clostridium sediminicola TaxID=3114879 RepID=UPI0031F27F8D
MIKISGSIIKKTKIISEEIVSSTTDGSYQDKLKECITEICYRLDIEKPYWLPNNLEEYNKRNKTSFDEHNFVDEIAFDKFVIEEIEEI